jgi:hypothetical protein
MGVSLVPKMLVTYGYAKYIRKLHRNITGFKCVLSNGRFHLKCGSFQACGKTREKFTLSGFIQHLEKIIFSPAGYINYCVVTHDYITYAQSSQLKYNINKILVGKLKAQNKQINSPEKETADGTTCNNPCASSFLFYSEERDTRTLQINEIHKDIKAYRRAKLIWPHIEKYANNSKSN